MDPKKKTNTKSYPNKNVSGKGKPDYKGSDLEDRKDYNYGRNDKGKRATHINDYTWYVIDDKVGESTYNVPFNVFPGTREIIAESINNYDYPSTAGVMRINYVSIPGQSTSSISAINVAARAVYTFVRHQNSGHTNYEAPDLMIYILTMMEIYAHYFEACRMYKTAMTYTFINRYIPDTLLDAMGADPGSIREHIAQFRAGLNVLAAKISSMAVPDVFTSVLRSVYLASNIFGDSDSVKGQYYVPTLHCYRAFDPTLENGGGLVYQDGMATNARTYDQILDNLNYLVDKVLADEDMNIMSGDILKAYGKDRCYTLSMLSESDTITPVYDENFMSQIENAFIMPVISEYGPNEMKLAFDITQSSGYIICRGLFTTPEIEESLWEASVGKQILNDKVYFNSHRDNPTWKDVVDWSRFMLAVDHTDTDEGITYFSSGSEVITGAGIYFMNYYSDSNGSDIKSEPFSSVEQNINGNRLALISQFDWHPIIYVYTVSENTPYLSNKMGDLKNYTFVSKDTIKRMNEAAVLGEFGRQLALFLK